MDLSFYVESSEAVGNNIKKWKENNDKEALNKAQEFFNNIKNYWVNKISQYISLEQAESDYDAFVNNLIHMNFKADEIMSELKQVTKTNEYDCFTVSSYIHLTVWSTVIEKFNKAKTALSETTIFKPVLNVESIAA